LSLNWKEIDLILEELNVVDAHIQKIRQPRFHALILQLYRPKERFSLYLSLAQGRTRLHRLTRPVRGSIKTQRFVQFLKSRIIGGRITDAYQIGKERIVKITVVRAGETTHLWVRLWGGAANILVTDAEGTILDALYRRPKRNEVSGGFFHPEKSPSLIPEKKVEKEFEIRELPGEGPFNEKIERHYFDMENSEAREQQKSVVDRILNKKESKIETTLENLQTKKDNYEQFEKYKQYGDLITSDMHRIQKGDRWFETVNYFDDDGQTVTIELKPELTPAENADHYYNLYKKSKSGLDRLIEEIRSQEDELDRVRRDLRILRETADPEKVQELYEAYAGAESDEPAKAGKQQKVYPGLQFRSHGFTILVGRNARENDELLRYHTRGNDYWIHTRDYPGGYVFIKAESGKSVPLEALLDAGNLAIHYSKAKKAEEADLYYTQVKYLRRPKEGKKGLVIPTQEKNLSMKLDRERLARLQEQRSAQQQ
jgi:predicted ribosome quality control (RQC) complex YloA/Tae2 family protein